jgi:hypothetical protein
MTARIAMASGPAMSGGLGRPGQQEGGGHDGRAERHQAQRRRDVHAAEAQEQSGDGQQGA